MLFNGFARPLHLRRKASRLLAAYFLMLQSLSALALLQPLYLPGSVRVSLWLVWLAYGFWVWRYYRHAQDTVDAYWVWQTSTDWVNTAGGAPWQLIRTQTVQTPWFVVLRLRSPTDAKRTLLICPDQLDADTFRRLRVRLRHVQEETAARRAEPE